MKTYDAKHTIYVARDHADAERTANLLKSIGWRFVYRRELDRRVHRFTGTRAGRRVTIEAADRILHGVDAAALARSLAD